MAKLTHLAEAGQAHMVDVSEKPTTDRTARAEGHVAMRKETLDLALAGNSKKGDRLRCSADRRHHGGEENRRPYPALPSARVD